MSTAARFISWSSRMAGASRRREVAAIGQTLCGAVAAVHAAGLLHRDIKAQNVMMAREGRVALMDFGTGREQREGSEAVLAGTPLYLAPEVLTGASEPTVQADIYSIGVLLFFLLTGSYPVTGGDLAELRAAHERHERRSLNVVRPDVPRRLRGIIERAIDPDPARRYSNAAALASALSRVSAGAVEGGVVLGGRRRARAGGSDRLEAERTCRRGPTADRRPAARQRHDGCQQCVLRR